VSATLDTSSDFNGYANGQCDGQTLDIAKPGDYCLKGGYQLSVRFPNSGLVGRAITVEIKARFIPAP